MKKLLCIPSLLTLFLLTGINDLHAQKKKKKLVHDSNYYEMFPDKVTGRVYVGQKFTQFTIPSSGSMEDVQYRANHKLNLGIGATWHNYSLNVGYGFSMINKDGKIRQKTKGLDFQFHLYPHKWSVDIMLVMPKGMYMHPKGYAASNAASYYNRPDVKERLWGFAAYRVPNKEKFSYRSVMVQNEWQKKSAGSLLYGGEIYYGIIEGDSALVPASIESGFPQAGITEMNYKSIGVGGGYAYNAVINQHFYIMASLIANLKINLVMEERPEPAKIVKKTTIGPSAIYKAGIGYNSDNWGVGGFITGNALWIKGATSSDSYFLPAGVFRVQVTKKFDLKKKK